ncbi:MULTISPECIES: hypothetical protein [unclassified Synechococcus]|uniref:hypothetical protein n=1 Tax=unclassified Synechococcus TaxID=2626047 RepID=UPI0008FF18EA|nr:MULTISPECIES: hypothetical protein [unclassified Synechococcus]APD47051.1 hypothetical protein BM449_00350 [Synechococcus sp. SynAce01]TWB89042.1 hypothetical protein FB106_11450 [Synechococcus sp. Ace-Pa]
MGLPRLTVKLFDPKPGKSYLGAGNLTIPISDVHAFAEWLLGQPGEHDDYLKENVVKLLAFEYSNTSRSGNSYRTVQLKDPASMGGPGDYQTQPLSQPDHLQPSRYGHPAGDQSPSIDNTFDHEIPF